MAELTARQGRGFSQRLFRAPAGGLQQRGVSLGAAPGPSRHICGAVGWAPPAPQLGSARLEASLGAKRSICCHGQGIASAARATKREGSGAEAPV